MTPEIRFKGFTQDWEQRKLGDLAIFSKGSGYTKGDLVKKGTPIILYGRLYTKYQTVINQVDTFVDMKEKSIMSEGDEVIVPSSGESSEDISRASVVKNSGILLGGDLNIIKTNSDINSIFLALAISNGKQQKELSKKAQGKSIVHLHNSDLKKVKLIYPTVEEQIKVGNFLKKLDETIALHQEKLDKLKQLKKGYLQLMFPQKGEKIPMLRFAHFPFDWEQRRLKQLGEIQTGNTPSTNDIKNYDDGGTLWVTPTDIKSLITLNTAKKLSTEGARKARIAKAGSILVTSIASIGKNTLATKDMGFNQQINSLTPFSENDSYFLLTQSEIWSKKMKRSASSGTMQIVNKSEFSNITTLVPKFEEQKKIGNFFKQIDDTIALHQKKISTLQETKKLYLQKLFA